MRTTLLTLLAMVLCVSAARAISIEAEDAWRGSDAVVVGSVRSVSSVRLVQEWAGIRFLLHRATVRATHVDGAPVRPRDVTFYYMAPAPEPNTFIDTCPPFVELVVGQRLKLGGELREVQGLGRVLWIPSGDYTRLQK